MSNMEDYSRKISSWWFISRRRYWGKCYIKTIYLRLKMWVNNLIGDWNFSVTLFKSPRFKNKFWPDGERKLAGSTFTAVEYYNLPYNSQPSKEKKKWAAVSKDWEIGIHKLLKNYQQSYDNLSGNRELTTSSLTVPPFIIAKVMHFLQ